MWKAGLLISLFLLGRADCFHLLASPCQWFLLCAFQLLHLLRLPLPLRLHTSSAELGLLESWAYLKRIPKCWSSLKPLLCALNAPQCSNTQEASLRVPKALCRALRGPCRGLRSKYLPLSLQARWDATFNCSGDLTASVRSVARTSSSSTSRKKKASASSLSFQHNTPLTTSSPSTDADSNAFHPIRPGAIWENQVPHRFWRPGLLAHLALCHGNALSRLEGILLLPQSHHFYMNLCSLLFISGWGLQFLQGEDSIVCNPDGTRRVLEPGEGQDLSCVAVFVLVYYFGLASALWYTVLAYSWDALFSSMGHLSAMSQRDLLLKRTPYFHMISWSIPAILSIAIISLNGVEGDPLTGICFVSKRSPPFYYGFVIAPLGIIALVSSFFVCKEVAIEISGVSGRSRRIRATTIKILLYASLYLACFLIAMSSAHWIGYEEKRDEAILNMYLDRHSSRFISVIASASWVWNKNTFKSWRKFFRRRFNASEERMKDIKVRKHELITQAFAKRKDLAAEGRLSLTFESSRFDP
ncbi:Protein smoothenedlike, partial [Caligus rogercresseyi]